MSNNKRIGIAICGLGRAGSIHLNNCIINPLVKIKYLVDLDVQKIVKIKEELYLEDVKILHADDFQTVLDDDEVSGVIISTVTHTHEELVKKCIKGGKPIFCEKPIAENAKDIESCYVEAEKNDVPLFCAFNRRFDDTHSKVKTAAQNGEIGKLHMVKTCSRDSPLPSIDYLKISGGIYHDCAVHDIDLIIWVLNEYPSSVFSYANAFRKEIAEINDVDTVSITMKFPSGAIGQIDLSRLATYGYDQRLEVFGELGMLESVNHTKTCHIKSNENGICKDVIDFSFPQRYDNAYKAELKHFIDIVNKCTKSSVTKEQVLVISLIASACEESHKTGKAMTIDCKKLTFAPVS